MDQSQDLDVIDELFEKSSAKTFNLQDILSFAEKYRLDLKRVRNSNNQTLLHIASGFKRRSIVSYLLEEGADANAKDCDGLAPLHYSCNHGHDKITCDLIKYGAEVNSIDSKGRTPLHFVVARKANVVKITPSDWEVVKYLLEQGANPFIQSNSGHNCFSRIQDSHQRLLVRLDYLTFKLKKCNLHDQESTVDRYLRVKDFFEMIKICDDDTPEALSIEVLKASLTKRLINSRLESLGNITPLHRAAGYDRKEVAELLISSGADVNAEDDDGLIPLHNAAQYGHTDIIILLSKKGSDIDKQDCDGSTPIHLAVAAAKNAFYACQILRGFGANISLKNNDGKLPYDLAVSNDVRELLNISTDMVQSIPDPEEMNAYQNICNNDTLLIEYFSQIIEERNQFIENRTSQVTLKKGFPVEKIALNESEWPYQSIRKRMHDTIGVHTGESACQYTAYDILSIEMVLNLAVWTKHKLKRTAVEIDHGSVSINDRLLFHGSSFIDNIVSKGFDQSYANRAGMFGAGLYFAEHSSKSNQYTFGWNQGCQKHKDKCCFLCERKLIFAQVTLGKCLKTKEDMQDLNHAPPGYSSVAGEPGPNLCYPEYCIYNGDQAYPSFVIRYRIKPMYQNMQE